MKLTPELHINKQVSAAEVGLCLVPFEALLGIQLPTQLLLPQSPEQQVHRAPWFLLPSSATSKQLGLGGESQG